MRAVAERAHAQVAAHGLGRVRVDRAGAVAAAACDDGKVYGVSVADPSIRMGELVGHDDAVQVRTTFVVSD